MCLVHVDGPCVVLLNDAVFGFCSKAAFLCLILLLLNHIGVF